MARYITLCHLSNIHFLVQLLTIQKSDVKHWPIKCKVQVDIDNDRERRRKRMERQKRLEGEKSFDMSLHCSSIIVETLHVLQLLLSSRIEREKRGKRQEKR